MLRLRLRLRLEGWDTNLSVFGACSDHKYVPIDCYKSHIGPLVLRTVDKQILMTRMNVR